MRISISELKTGACMLTIVPEYQPWSKKAIMAYFVGNDFGSLLRGRHLSVYVVTPTHIAVMVGTWDAWRTWELL